MKIAVSASGMDLKAQVDPRFGQCDYLLIVNTDNMDVEVCPNTYKDANSGAGIQAASLVVGKLVPFVSNQIFGIEGVCVKHLIGPVNFLFLRRTDPF